MLSERESPESSSVPDDGILVWAPRPAAVAVTVLLALPALLGSAALLGIVLAGFVGPLATSVGACAGLVLGAGRVLIWASVVGRRVLVATAEGLEVHRGRKVIRVVAWDGLESIELVPGTSMGRLALDLTASPADFPCVVGTQPGQWGDSTMLPPLMAVLPREFERLDRSLREVCAGRAVKFSAGSPM